VRNVVVRTARATLKVARATVAGARRTTATTVTTAATAAMMSPNGNKHNNQILSRHQRQEQECQETRPAADQLRWHITHVFPPLLGWVQASQAQSVSGRTEGMMDGCAGGGEVALQITGVQKKKKEKAKISPVEGADT